MVGWMNGCWARTMFMAGAGLKFGWMPAKIVGSMYGCWADGMAVTGAGKRVD